MMQKAIFGTLSGYKKLKKDGMQKGNIHVEMKTIEVVHNMYF